MKKKRMITRSFKTHVLRKKPEEESTTLKLPSKTKPETMITFGISSILGTRKNQEDTVFAHGDGTRALAIVCDGMGGLDGGEVASRSAADSLADAWSGQPFIQDVPGFLQEEAKKADTKVYLQEKADGEPLCAGTTIVAALIQENELYWLSVGDSRIYIIRGHEMIAVNREHNYRMLLDDMLKRGEITYGEYASEQYRAEALISYLGMGNVSLMDINQQAFLLAYGDIVLLSSDGLYRSVPEDEILAVVMDHKEDMQAAAEALTTTVAGKMIAKQDNASVVLLQYTLRSG